MERLVVSLNCWSISGKTVVITGASSGIGAATARRLAAAGAQVIPVGRSLERTASVAADIGAEPLIADFSELANVTALAAELSRRVERVDVLINNAAAIFSSRQVSPDGYEMTLQVNHLAPYLLTRLLIPRLTSGVAPTPARVITTSSSGHLFGRLQVDDLHWCDRQYGHGLIAYCTTKLMNVLFTRQLAHELAGTGVQAFAIHPDPGRKRSGVGRPTRLLSGSVLDRRVPDRILRRLALTDEDGASALEWLASAAEPPGPSGAYFHGYARERWRAKTANDSGLAAELWRRSHAMVT